MNADVLVAMVLHGLAAAGLAALVRASPWPARWLARKPLSCVACMAGHASWVVLGAVWLAGIGNNGGLTVTVLTWLGSTAVAAVLLAQTGLFVQGFSFEAQPGETPTSPPADPHGQ